MNYLKKKKNLKKFRTIPIKIFYLKSINGQKCIEDKTKSLLNLLYQIKINILQIDRVEYYNVELYRTKY